MLWLICNIDKIVTSPLVFTCMYSWNFLMAVYCWWLKHCAGWAWSFSPIYRIIVLYDCPVLYFSYSQRGGVYSTCKFISTVCVWMLVACKVVSVCVCVFTCLSMGGFCMGMWCLCTHLLVCKCVCMDVHVNAHECVGCVHIHYYAS